MPRSIARVGGLVVGILLLALAALPALAQEASVTIREARSFPDGATRLLVQVGGAFIDQVLDTSAFAVTENGEEVAGVTVEPLLEAVDREAVAVMLAIDTSGSAEGQPIAQAKAAAEAFALDASSRGVLVGLITFSNEAVLHAPPTANVDGVVAAIQAIEAAGATALNDAVMLAADTLAAIEGQRTIVLFTDGADTVSTATSEDAGLRAATFSVPIITISLTSPDTDEAALQQLASATGGQVVPVADAEQLQGAFGEIIQEIASQYVLTYSGTDAEAGELDIAVTVSAAGSAAQHAVTIINTRTGEPVPTSGPAAPRPIVVGDPGLIGSPFVLWGALLAGFVGLALFMIVLVVPQLDKPAERYLKRSLRVYTRGGGAQANESTTGMAASSLGRAAVDLVGTLPKPKGYEDRLQLELDRSGWPIRASEFLVVRVVGAVLALAVGWGLTGRWWLGIVLALAAGLLPRLALRVAVSRRQKAFLSQLPDTLQLLSGALKAGYGLLQAIDTVVSESPEPTKVEFQRVLTEARLGLPLNEALDDMASRIGIEDFAWVVVAINIQTQAGGNLAELLDTIAETLREREMVRRQIQALSAEGRLSAFILVALPFGLGGYLAIINPEYVGVLFTHTFGRIMVAGGLVLMGVGIVWMRNLIKIDV